MSSVKEATTTDGENDAAPSETSNRPCGSLPGHRYRSWKLVASAAVAGRKLQRSRGIVRATQMDSIPGWLVGRAQGEEDGVAPLLFEFHVDVKRTEALTVNGAESSPL